jgi:hypothetical protein
VGVSLIAMGLWTLRPDSLEEGALSVRRRGAFVADFFIAEIGDKTHLVTVSLAVAYAQVTMVVVVAGTCIAMLLANAPVVFLGKEQVRRPVAQANHPRPGWGVHRQGVCPTCAAGAQLSAAPWRAAASRRENNNAHVAPADTGPRSPLLSCVKNEGYAAGEAGLRPACALLLHCDEAHGYI